MVSHGRWGHWQSWGMYQCSGVLAAPGPVQRGSCCPMENWVNEQPDKYENGLFFNLILFLVSGKASVEGIVLVRKSVLNLVSI